MGVSSGPKMISAATDQEGEHYVEELTRSEADEDLLELSENAEVPLLRAMQIARSEASGNIMEAQLESRENGLIVWSVTVEGTGTESTTVIDANNGAVVPEGDDPLRENNIGGDPENPPDEGAGE